MPEEEKYHFKGDPDNKELTKEEAKQRLEEAAHSEAVDDLSAKKRGKAQEK